MDHYDAIKMYELPLYTVSWMSLGMCMKKRVRKLYGLLKSKQN